MRGINEMNDLWLDRDITAVHGSLRALVAAKWNTENISIYIVVEEVKS